jgi:hypothetical protein
MSIEKKRDLILLFLTAVLVRVLFVLYLSNNGFTLEKAVSYYPDSITYTAPAEMLLDQHQFLNADGKAEIVRTPGYPLMIAISKLLFPNQWASFLIIFQIGLNVAAVLTLYLLLTMLIPNRSASLLACLIAVLNIHDVYFSCFILTDSLYQSISFIGIFFFIRFLKEFRLKDLIWSSLAFLAALFIRPSGLFLPLLLMIALPFVIRNKFTHLVKVEAILFLIVYLPVICWGTRNANVAGYRGFSAITEQNLYFYHAAGINAELNQTDFYTEQENLQENPEYLQRLPTVSPETAQRELATTAIRNNFAIYLKLNIQGMGLILIYPGTMDIFRFQPDNPDIIEPIKQAYLQGGAKSALIELLISPIGLLTLLDVGALIVLVLITIIGTVRSFQSQLPWYIPLAILGFFLYNLGVSAGPNGFGTYPRFRLSVSLIQALIAGFFFEWVLQRMRFVRIKYKSESAELGS